MELTPELQRDMELLDDLLTKRFVLNRRINKIRKNLGLPKEIEPPVHQCKRCGYGSGGTNGVWVGRIVHRQPSVCPRCHSALWNVEPYYTDRKYKPARKPSDPPNPNWATKWGKRAAPAETESSSTSGTLPPPPRLSGFMAGFPRLKSVLEYSDERRNGEPVQVLDAVLPSGDSQHVGQPETRPDAISGNPPRQDEVGEDTGNHGTDHSETSVG